MNALKFPIIVFSLVTGLVAQDVVINEFMASNTRSVPDVTDFEDYPDWIELHNTSASAVSLKGFYLSDNLGDPSG